MTCGPGRNQHQIGEQSCEQLAGGKQFRVSWHPVRKRIASVIAGTGGAEVWLQLGEPPPNAGFPGERSPWTSARTSIRHWLGNFGESRL